MNGELAEIHRRFAPGFEPLPEGDASVAEKFIRNYYKNIVEKWMNPCAPASPVQPLHRAQELQEVLHRARQCSVGKELGYDVPDRATAQRPHRITITLIHLPQKLTEQNDSVKTRSRACRDVPQQYLIGNHRIVPCCALPEAQTGTTRTARLPRITFLFAQRRLPHDRLLDTVHNVVNIVIGDHRAGRKAEANLEQLFLNAVSVNRR